MIDGLQRERICSRTTECGRQGQVLAVPSSALECPSGKPKTHKSSQVSLLRARAVAAPLCAAHTPCASPPCIAAHTGQQSYKKHAHPTAGGHRPHGQQKGKNAKKKICKKTGTSLPLTRLQPPAGCHRPRPLSRRRGHVASAGNLGVQAQSVTSRKADLDVKKALRHVHWQVVNRRAAYSHEEYRPAHNSFVRPPKNPANREPYAGAAAAATPMPLTADEGRQGTRPKRPWLSLAVGARYAKPLATDASRRHPGFASFQMLHAPWNSCFPHAPGLTKCQHR